MDLIVRGGTLITARSTLQADIGVRGRRIAAVGDLREFEARSEFDAAGQLVFPGFIDAHVHSRDPGLTHKEDFAHSTRAAAAGGVTTILEMPNSVPPVVDANSFVARAAHLAESAFVDFGLWAMVLGDRNREALDGLAESGAVGFKLFLGYALDPRTLELVYAFDESDGLIMPPDEGAIFDAFTAIASLNRPVAVHAESSFVIARLTERARKSGDDYASFLRSRPPFTETIAVRACVDLAAATGAHLHVLHVAAGEAADAVAAARTLGVPVTGETCPHYLVLTDRDFARAGAAMKIYPPVREASHGERLWSAIKAGRLQTLGSDHAPHAVEEKSRGLWVAPAGASSVQLTVPIMLDALRRRGLPLNLLAALLAENPARVFGLFGRKGVIRPGADADLTVVDPDREIRVREQDMLSKSRLTPYEGWRVRGAPTAAFLRGRQIMADGVPVGEPNGELVRASQKSEAFW